MTKIWTAAELVAMFDDMSVLKNRIFTERALLKLYARQTADEQELGLTSHQNGMGFNGPDAQYLTWAAEWVMGSRKPEGYRLNVMAGPKGTADRHYAKVAKKLRKYTRQLLEEIESHQTEGVAA